MRKYVGITIGPIHDTMMLSSKPAGLWAASYLFSYMGRELCQKISMVYQDSCNMLVPAVDFKGTSESNATLEKMNAGIGLFHDRIIFEIDSDSAEAEIIADVEKQVIIPVKSFCVSKILESLKCEKEQAFEELMQYFQIYAICLELNENQAIIPAVSGALDILELQKQFTVEVTGDYLYQFLNDNSVIKNCYLSEHINPATWQLLKHGDAVKSIEDISGEKAYFALVQADGDGMGKVLCTLNQPEAIRDFSRKCLKYASKASEIIGEYGGITIYAGGDDLLFLAPVEPDKKNLLSLIQDLRDTFLQEFQDDKFKGCNVSYGVEIVYYKFPLYEALEMVGHQLFAEAKAKRNSCAISVQKHSGQSFSFVIHNFRENSVTSQIADLIEQKIDSLFLKSAWKHIAEMQPIFDIAKREGKLANAFQNVFDNQEQKVYRKDIERIQNMFMDMQDVSSKQEQLPILSILRFADFYSVRRLRR